MAFEIRQSQRGPAAYWNGKLLSSAYDPQREASNWAESITAEPGSLVFVAGDPWGLACAALEKRGASAVALLPGLHARSLATGRNWAPEDGALEAFIEGIFDSTGPDGVSWQVWPAFERLAPELALDWSRRFRDVFRTVQGSWLTQRRFGPRFWHNAVRNTLDWEQRVQLAPGTRPIVIAASGPSLDDGLEALARNRGQFDLWALPSSFETLVQRGLSPDAGVATDGGFYAREHLHRLAGTTVPLLAALGSAPDPQLSGRPCLFFSQGLRIENLLLKSFPLSFPEVPSQGTVAVTALRLALEATQGPVFIAGLDLAFRDLRGHTSPHTVDRRVEGQHRLAPAEGWWAQRLFEQATVTTGSERTSPALLTYAGWFQSRARFSRTVYRIAPSSVRWDSMTEVSWAEAQSAWGKAGSPVRWSPVNQPSRVDRRRLVEKALETLKAKIDGCKADDPWLVEVARTAVPEVLAEEFRAARSGSMSPRLGVALSSFVSALRGAV